MGQAAQKIAFTAADYLRWEAEQVERHEYLDGEVFAMMSDMRLHVASANCYFYPDVLVTCSAQDRLSALSKSEPELIVEVLSPYTAARDRNLKFNRGLKLSHYRSLPSLEEYVLIDLDTRSTDCYRKGVDGLWVLHPFAKGEAVELASVALTISAAQLFAEVPEA